MSINILLFFVKRVLTDNSFNNNICITTLQLIFRRGGEYMGLMRDKRTALGLSQLQLAYAVQTTPATISRYENKMTDQPQLPTLKRIAKVLDCSLEDLANDFIQKEV